MHRIVHVITRFIRGGADENTLYTCNGQAALGHEVHLVVGDHHPEMIAALDRRVTVHIHRTLVRQPHPIKDLCFLAQCAALFRRIKPQIVHTHESKAGILGRYAAAMAGVPIIVHGVHILPFVGVGRAAAAVYLAMEKLAARVTRAYLDVSEGMQKICLENGLGTEANHFVVPSGMDTARYRTAGRLARDAIVSGRVIPENATIGLISGTLEPRKQVAEVIRALLEETDRAAEWCLLIAGSGAQEADLERLVSELGGGDRIHLLGHRDDLPALIATADICLHAARNEGLPRVVLQYVLGGKPVVATSLPGIQRVVQPGVNGSLVPVDSPRQVAREFLELAGDKARQERFAKAALDQDLSAWDADRMVQRIEEVYDWAMGGKRSASAGQVHQMPSRSGTAS